MASSSAPRLSTLDDERSPALTPLPLTPVPLTPLLGGCLDACEALTPLASRVYQMVEHERRRGGAEATRNKLDGSLFTLADGLVQAMLERLLAPLVTGVIAEEDSSSLQIEARPYSVCGLQVPETLEPLVEQAKEQIDSIGGRLRRQLPSARLDAIAVIDPIDGTKEFGSGKGDQCTICVGLASADGRPLGGIVYRPLDHGSPTWAMGCRAEGLTRSRLRERTSRGGFLCSAGRVSPFLTYLASEMQLPLTPAGGAGNKVLLLLEGEGAAYVQDRGLSRWDTCAAQAVLEAHGGVLAQLQPFEARGEVIGYTYRPSSVGSNSDFEPGVARLTKYNAAPDARHLVSDGVMASEVSQVQPYANMLGLLALPSSASQEGLARCLEAVRSSARVHAPEYD